MEALRWHYAGSFDGYDNFAPNVGAPGATYLGSGQQPYLPQWLLDNQNVKVISYGGSTYQTLTYRLIERYYPKTGYERYYIDGEFGEWIYRHEEVTCYFATKDSFSLSRFFPRLPQWRQERGTRPIVPILPAIVLGGAVVAIAPSTALSNIRLNMISNSTNNLV